MKLKGFKAGLEIHQRLDTHKLFCSCSSVGEKELNLRVHRDSMQ